MGTWKVESWPGLQRAITTRPHSNASGTSHTVRSGDVRYIKPLGSALRGARTTMAIKPYTGPWSANRVREEFFTFFRSKGHVFVPSSSTIPYEDPTLLFANAGMNQVLPQSIIIKQPSR